MQITYTYTYTWYTLVYSKGSDVDVELLLHYYSAPLILATLPLTTLCISLTKIVKTDGSKTYISKTLVNHIISITRSRIMLV